LAPDVGPIVSARPAAIREAAALLRSHQLVVFPTETVYGIGGNATRDDVVADIFAAKGRPKFNPLIIHVVDGAQASKFAALNATARKLIDTFWPGPLTLVAQRLETSTISSLACAGLETVALRAPANPIARSLIINFGHPLAAPSANRSEALSPTLASHIDPQIRSAVALVLDGGPCEVGVESTIVDTTIDPPVILRPGGLTVDEISAVIGPLGNSLSSNGVRAPGMLRRHYAPSHPLRLNAYSREPGEVLLGFGPQAPVDAPNLSPTGDLREAAANLFAMLRSLDATDATQIAIMPIPNEGLGHAINDRLTRAAAPK
jgi:L-threonylcarbamoyladenylate synthase